MPIVALLEVLDFPPIAGIFDAHAVWHGATIPLVFLFYSFILDDARYEGGLVTQKTL
jgi:hypothetical protein